jgi:hypothetical protein
MLIVGVDYHPSFQEIAFLNQETGECGDQQLNHGDGEAEKFYRELKQRGASVRVGMEATGYARWFERLLAELGFELWIGDPAVIKTKRVRKKKTDREDARLLLRLQLENHFPIIWVPTPENRDLRQLLWHRHRLVQMRTRIMNQLQAVAMNEGKRWKKKTVQRTGTGTVGEVAVSSLGQSASERVAGNTRPPKPNHRGVNRRRRAGSQKTARGAAADDSSWRGTNDGTGFRADHRNLGTVSLRQADRQLCGSRSVRRLQRWPATAGTHQQARQHSAALLAGGSSASGRALGSGLATSVSPPGDASRPSHCQSGYGTQARRSVVLDVAQWPGVFAVSRVRFARGAARNRP